jgi:hypothetical protein
MPTDGGFTQIFSNYWGFLAMKADGSLHGWGRGILLGSHYGQYFSKNFGAAVPPGIGDGFVTVSSAPSAYAALRSNGEIVSWGHYNTPTGVAHCPGSYGAMPYVGGVDVYPDAGACAPSGTGFTDIFANDCAFAALSSDGHIATWGAAVAGSTWGSDLCGVGIHPTDGGFVEIFANKWYWAARKADGTVHSWSAIGGTTGPNGDNFGWPKGLASDPKFDMAIRIATTEKGFAGVLTDGRLFDWGQVGRYVPKADENSVSRPTPHMFIFRVP